MNQKEYEQGQAIRKLFAKPEVQKLIQEIEDRPESLEAMRDELRHRSEDQIQMNVERFRTMLHSQEILEELAGDFGTVESDLCVDVGIGNICMDIPLIDEKEFAKLKEAVEGAGEVTIIPMEKGRLRVWLVFHGLFEYKKIGEKK